MVKITELISLDADDVGKKRKITITDEAKEIKFKDDKDKEYSKFQCNVQLADGDMRLWTMNNKSRNVLMRIYGSDTKDWIGKSVELFTVTQSVHGVNREIVYARA